MLRRWLRPLEASFAWGGRSPCFIRNFMGCREFHDWRRQNRLLASLIGMMARMNYRSWVLVAAVGLLGVMPLQAREGVAEMADLKQLEGKVMAVAEKAMGSTVALVSEKTGASGSGVVVGEDGLILTAAHVIQGADQVVVVFPDGKQVKGKVLGANFSKDIAMVRILESGPWPALGIGVSKDLKPGDWVVAMGHSTGYDASRPPPVRFGRVISLGPGTFLTTDCTLIGGDSGGPLFDLDGRVIGVNSSIGRSISNNNHAGIEGFREDWDKLLGGETWGELTLNPFANPEMPVLGIRMGLMSRYKGVLVDAVVQGSPAAAAGVRRGDIILSVDGSELANGAELMQVLAKRKAGDEVALGLVRGRQEMELNVVLQRRSELFEMR